MKVYEALQQNAEILTSLARTGVSIEDVNHLPIYREFSRLRKDGLKTTYIVAHLCDEYTISERTVWRIVKKFERNVVATGRHP